MFTLQRRAPREIEILRRKVQRGGKKRHKIGQHKVQKEPAAMSKEKGKKWSGVHKTGQDVTNHLTLKITKKSRYRFKQFKFYLVFTFALYF